MIYALSRQVTDLINNRKGPSKDTLIKQVIASKAKGHLNARNGAVGMHALYTLNCELIRKL